MADRYDPKVTVRPTTDRKASDTNQGPAASDDPLFELARIVSGRGGGGASASATPPSRGRPAPPAEPPKPAAPEPDILGDLEAELLSDLQSSFAAVKGAVEPKAPSSPAPEAPPAPPAAANPTSTPSRVPPVEPPRPPQPEAAVSHAPAPHQPPRRVPAAARPPIQQMPPRQAAAPAAPPQGERPHAPPPSAAAAPKKVEASNFNLRPTGQPHARVAAAPPEVASPETPAPAAARSSRWDRPAEPPKPQAPAASRFAPPRTASYPAQPAPVQPSPPPPLPDEEEPTFGEGLPFALDGEEATDEFPLDAFDIVPGYGDEAELPPYPDDDLEPLGKRGVPRSLVAVAGILALVLVGVLGFVLLRPGSSSTGTPPIIAADAGPTKIAPPEPPAANGGEQNKLIYDRVDSGTSNTSANTNLVTPGSQPIAPVPSSNDSNNAIARVILPGGPGSNTDGATDAGTPGDNGTNLATNDSGTPQSIGPRKVRTVVVRPDGTIVSSDAVPAPGDAPASTDAPAADTASNVPEVPPVPTNDDTAAIAGSKSGAELPITATPGAMTAPAETPTRTATAEPRTPKPTPTPEPAPTKPKVVSSNGGGPLDLTPGKGQAPTQVAARTPSAGTGAALPLVAGGMMVQVSSQRSQDAAQATFRDLQARYPSILGGYQADIQRADLGSRGTYYRVRVGPFDSANAQNLCSALKDAGGDCILASR